MRSANEVGYGIRRSICGSTCSSSTSRAYLSLIISCRAIKKKKKKQFSRYSFNIVSSRCVRISRIFSVSFITSALHSRPYYRPFLSCACLFIKSTIPGSGLAFTQTSSGTTSRVARAWRMRLKDTNNLCSWSFFPLSRTGILQVRLITSFRWASWNERNLGSWRRAPVLKMKHTRHAPRLFGFAHQMPCYAMPHGLQRMIFTRHNISLLLGSKQKTVLVVNELDRHYEDAAAPFEVPDNHRKYVPMAESLGTPVSRRHRQDHFVNSF